MTVEIPTWLVEAAPWAGGVVAYLLMGALVAGVCIRWGGVEDGCADDCAVVAALFWPAFVGFAAVWLAARPFVWLARWVGGRK